ncbi:rhodanese-like domain-containing protein [Halalkalicoccus salilacus]|uniref:rhodanese-like domain-containing protein n=1 Tax=Halalkalicoccus sp. GCM10025704 TaxID=3252662 RepID=UPI0036151733
MNRSDVYTLDVHVPEQRHIEGTNAFIPYDSIRDYRHLLPDEDVPIALYCRSDSMSRQVTDVLSKQATRRSTSFGAASRPGTNATSRSRSIDSAIPASVPSNEPSQRQR